MTDRPAIRHQCIADTIAQWRRPGPRPHIVRQGGGSISGDRRSNSENIMQDNQKVVIVTGASQGIGAALVEAYRARNYRVVATSRSIEPAAGADLLAIRGDIGDPATGPRVVAQALEHFGRVDTLINNAGIFLANRFTRYSGEEYDRVVA